MSSSSDSKGEALAVDNGAQSTQRRLTADQMARARAQRRSDSNVIAGAHPWACILSSLMLVVGVSAAAITSSADRLDAITSYVDSFKIDNLPQDLRSLWGSTATFGSAWINDVVFGKGDSLDRRRLPLSMFIGKQERTSWQRLLDNIHPQGTDPGCVVASPSREQPDYWYQWSRDSALVMRNLVDQFVKTGHFRREIDEYIQETQKLQRVETTIGGFRTGGLGDVKYNVDGTAFTGEWGRPQDDGPALRVLTLTTFARELLKSGSDEDNQFVKTVLYDGALPTESVIKADLEYIAHNWRQPGFDLWEEVSGQHFYTQMAIHRALQTGASLAIGMGDHGAATFYASEAKKVENTINEFWSEERGRIRVTVNHTSGRVSDENPHQGDATYGKASELDTAVLLAVLHSGRGTAWETDSRLFATLDKIIRIFEPLYPVNQGKPVPALGRYDTDRYDGIGLSEGHPWYLCTLAASEILYRSSRALSRSRSPFVIEPHSHEWYGRFVDLSSLPVKRKGENRIELAPQSKPLRQIIRGQRRMADQFVGVVQEYVRLNGSMSEQFHRTTGEGRGARDLTWSYAAFITTAQARRGN
ncbi:hypothetical protein OIO90_006040 [Microbotryomycetes sp. JL221]|nr:hypothetical protein OIO90_006040 [Microbotryomycetes sp. JL221]